MLSRAQVHQWLEMHAPEYATTNWTGIDRIRVSRRTRSLDEIEVRDMLRNALQQEHVKQKGELEIRLTRTWNSVAVPDEALALRIVDVPATGPSANFIVRFELWNGEERIGNWQVSAAAKIWRELPVAQAPLKRGQLLADAVVGFERRDVLALRDAPGVFDVRDASLELVENIGAGQPILARSIRQRPVVRRGELVDAVLEDGALVISLKVETLQDGLPGQLVRVRNLRTRRELMGKVLDEKTILIAM
jgi:flagella basal body P-ring formation protein FlgA